MEVIERIIKDDNLYISQGIKEPVEYLRNQHGKQIRSVIIKEFSKLFTISTASVDLICEVISEFHTASLLIDDIEDNANLRRGKITAHKKFGTWVTLNSAQFSVYRSISKLIDHASNSGVSSVVIEELLRLHVGQGEDIYWRDNGIVPTIEEYYEMAKNKTGGLFRLIIRLLEVFSNEGTEINLIPMANALGILYQIRDDYLNLFSEQMFEQKGFADDLTEGKFSFPLIHSINTEGESDSKYVLNTLKSRPTDVDSKKKLLHFMRNTTKSDQYTRDIVKKLGQSISSNMIPVELESLRSMIIDLCELK